MNKLTVFGVLVFLVFSFGVVVAGGESGIIEQNFGELDYRETIVNEDCDDIIGGECSAYLGRYYFSDGAMGAIVNIETHYRDFISSEFISRMTEQGGEDYEKRVLLGNNVLFNYYSDGNLKATTIVWTNNDKIITLVVGPLELSYSDDPLIGSMLDVYFDEYPSDLVFNVSDEADECYDSDGGKDYNTKGRISFGNEFALDICLKDRHPDYGEQEEKTLVEYFCMGDEEDYGMFHDEWHICENGCEDGACFGELENGENCSRNRDCSELHCLNSICQPMNCSDSDGGKDYFNKGEVSGRAPIALEDYCDGDMLVENFCPTYEFDGGIEFYYGCPNGCEDGACVGGGADKSSCDGDGICVLYVGGEVGSEPALSGNEISINRFYDSGVDLLLSRQEVTNVLKVGDKYFNSEFEIIILEIDGDDKIKFDFNMLIDAESIPDVPISESGCDNGCALNEKCFNFGYRKAINGELKYCFESGDWAEQKGADESCENNFECDSNLCIDGECVSAGLFRRIMNWFRRLFS